MAREYLSTCGIKTKAGLPCTRSYPWHKSSHKHDADNIAMGANQTLTPEEFHARRLATVRDYLFGLGMARTLHTGGYEELACYVIPLTRDELDKRITALEEERGELTAISVAAVV